MGIIIELATARKRNSKSWQTKSVDWNKLTAALSQPRRTAETMIEYNKMSRDEQSNVKDVGGFVGGVLDGGQRSADSVLYRTMFTLDADYADENTWDLFKMLIGSSAVKYSTHKDRQTSRRFRIVGPYDRKVTPEEHEAIGRKIAELVGIEYFDDTTYQACRLMYWPSVSSDQQYDYDVCEGDPICADEILAMYGDNEEWKDASNWAVSSRVGEARIKSAERQGDPLEKPGEIGQFCRAYSIEEAIATFLPDKYEPCDKEGRYTYVGGSTAAGLVLYQDGLFAYSNHATDPVGGMLVNAFDLVRIHKFGHLDDGVKTDIGISAMPSSKAMREFARKDGRVKEIILSEKEEEIQNDFAEALAPVQKNEPEAEEVKDWKNKLTFDRAGNVEGTQRNMLYILQNDSRLKNIIRYDEFSHKTLLGCKPPWSAKTGNVGDLWTDETDSCLRNYINIAYGARPKSELKDATTQRSLMNCVHPVKEYLDSLDWDGVNRIDKVLIDYLGADDNAYVRAVTRAMLVAAVKRIYEPGCKFDEMIVLCGAQAIGKTTFVQKLGKTWFGKCTGDIESKDALQAMDGRWLIEMGEMRAKRRSDNNAMKNFLSSTSDIYRPAYGRYVKEYKRQCIFIGTTNDDDFLQDATGDRRSFPVTCHGVENGWQAILDLPVDQIWAEAKVLYELSEPITISSSVKELAEQERDKYRSDTEILGMVEEHLNIPVPKNWADMNLSQRFNYFDEQESELGADLVETELRDHTCVMEVVKELFNGDTSKRGQVQKALKMSRCWESCGSKRFKLGLGPQRMFRRKKVTNGY